MVLQHIIWPKACASEKTNELYYHTNIAVENRNESVIIAPETELKLDGYYNAFISSVWKEKTTVESVSFLVRLTGTGTVQLRDEQDRILDSAEYHDSKVELQTFDLSTKMLYLCICAKSCTTVLEGQIETDAVTRQINLTLVTCTFNRKESLFSNLDYISKKNKEESYKGTMNRICVVDNAKNIEENEVNAYNVEVFPNPNTGGAGGFTRGLKEAIKDSDMTHVILMDDDVEVSFEAIYRTKSLLSVLKGDYHDNFIGGAMFRMDTPWVLHASGEEWNNSFRINPYKDVDLTQRKNVSLVMENRARNQAYAGWWYCCVPRTHIENKGFPLPLFLHVDDVEYSLRSKKQPIFLNGIAIWHEEFDDKRSSVIEYYDTRNRLIVNSIYKKDFSKKDVIYVAFERFYSTVFRYRYKDYALSCKAIEDYLRGPDWLYGLDSEAYNGTLSDYGYKMHKTDDNLSIDTYKDRSKAATIARYFLPASKNAVIAMGAPVMAYAGKKKVLLIDKKRKVGFESSKSFKGFFSCLSALNGIVLKSLFDKKKAIASWKSESDRIG